MQWGKQAVFQRDPRSAFLKVVVSTFSSARPLRKVSMPRHIIKETSFKMSACYYYELIERIRKGFQKTHARLTEKKADDFRAEIDNAILHATNFGTKDVFIVLCLYRRSQKVFLRVTRSSDCTS